MQADWRGAPGAPAAAAAMARGRQVGGSRGDGDAACPSQVAATGRLTPREKQLHLCTLHLPLATMAVELAATQATMVVGEPLAMAGCSKTTIVSRCQQRNAEMRWIVVPSAAGGTAGSAAGSGGGTQIGQTPHSGTHDSLFTHMLAHAPVKSLHRFCCRRLQGASRSQAKHLHQPRLNASQHRQQSRLHLPAALRRPRELHAYRPARTQQGTLIWMGEEEGQGEGQGEEGWRCS